MIFSSGEFLIFFPAVFIVYWLIKGKETRLHLLQIGRAHV